MPCSGSDKIIIAVTNSRQSTELLPSKSKEANTCFMCSSSVSFVSFVSVVSSVVCAVPCRFCVSSWSFGASPETSLWSSLPLSLPSSLPSSSRFVLRYPNLRMAVTNPFSSTSPCSLATFMNSIRNSANMLWLNMPLVNIWRMSGGNTFNNSSVLVFWLKLFADFNKKAGSFKRCTALVQKFALVCGAISTSRVNV